MSIYIQPSTKGDLIGRCPHCREKVNLPRVVKERKFEQVTRQCRGCGTGWAVQVWVKRWGWFLQRHDSYWFKLAEN